MKLRTLVFYISILFVLQSWIPLHGRISNVFAQSPTASSSADTIRDSVKQKVTEELAQIKKGVAKKGFVGSIASVADGSVSLTTIYSQSRKILVTAAAAIKLASGGDGTPGDLKPGQYILIMGDVDSQNTMTAKRLLIIPKPDTETRKVIFGAVAKSTTSSLTVGSDTYKITSATKFTNKNKASDLVPGAKVLAIVNSGSTTRIQIVSLAPSSTPVASSSATPKP